MKIYVVLYECSDSGSNCHFDKAFLTKEKAIEYVKKQEWVYNSEHHLANIKREPKVYRLITERDFIEEVEVE